MVCQRILIVDNNELFRATLANQLRAECAPVEVRQAAIGAEAVRVAAQLQPDVILLDIELPEMDAPASIQALQQSAPAARVVALSIVPNRRYAELCRLAGSAAYLPKDSPLALIVAAIHGSDD